MDKKAQLGMTLMHIYALLFLVFVFIIFLAIFPVLIGKVGEVSIQTGDLFTEQMLARVMSEKALFGDEMIYFQDALNSDLEKEKVAEKIAKRIAEELKRAKYSNYYVQIALEEEGDKKPLFLVEDEYERPGLSPLKGFSTACWPFMDDDGLRFIEVYIGNDNEGVVFGTYGDFKRGNIRC